MGSEWAAGLTLDLSPVTMPTDRAVTVGLVLTELIINVNKYAYGGQPGPLQITLTEHRADLRLTVADHGAGKASGSKREGFGSRMMEALVGQLRLDRFANAFDIGAVRLREIKILQLRVHRHEAGAHPSVEIVGGGAHAAPAK